MAGNLKNSHKSFTYYSKRSRIPSALSWQHFASWRRLWIVQCLQGKDVQPRNKEKIKDPDAPVYSLIIRVAHRTATSTCWNHVTHRNGVKESWAFSSHTVRTPIFLASPIQGASPPFLGPRMTRLWGIHDKLYNQDGPVTPIAGQADLQQSLRTQPVCCRLAGGLGQDLPFGLFSAQIQYNDKGFGRNQASLMFARFRTGRNTGTSARVRTRQERE